MVFGINLQNLTLLFLVLPFFSARGNVDGCGTVAFSLTRQINKNDSSIPVINSHWNPVEGTPSQKSIHVDC